MMAALLPNLLARQEKSNYLDKKFACLFVYWFVRPVHVTSAPMDGFAWKLVYITRVPILKAAWNYKNRKIEKIDNIGNVKFVRFKILSKPGANERPKGE